MYWLGVAGLVLNKFKLTNPPNMGGLTTWEQLADRVDALKNLSVDAVKIAVVGKYTNLSDAYLSVIRALQVHFLCSFSSSVAYLTLFNLAIFSMPLMRQTDDSK